MTLLEKIKNYKWFDSPNKLRAILEELYNSIGGGSGGGSQDLQSILDNGNTSFKEIALSNDYGEGEADSATYGSYGVNVEYTIPNKIFTAEYSSYILTLRENVLDTGNIIALSLTPQQLTINDLMANTSLQLQLSGADGVYSFPNKPTGVYTLATLDDIKKIDLSDRVYANNATAIAGGLTTNDVYRTSTGELRIVI